MSKKYTTAMGKSIDMASLRAKNEKVRAVGNMNVNARGDIIDSNNNVINDVNKRINSMYRKSTKPPIVEKNEDKKAKRNQKISEHELSKEELDFDAEDSKDVIKK